MHVLIIHGGAGTIPEYAADRETLYEASLARIIDSGFDILERGGTSLDAVTASVQMLEDDALFNAGRGAALARDGSAELDASIMDGRTAKAGAVACVKRVRNPVQLARLVMEKSRFVMLAGNGAEEFALEQGMPLVANQYFCTEERRLQLEGELRGGASTNLVAAAQGTVGAVALDERGDLAAATSTGGMTGKPPGRIGDSPIIGAGTYAKNGVCAVSATGDGECFMRAVAAHHVASAVEYRGLSLDAAANELIAGILPSMGGGGGIIAVDPRGNIVMQFNTRIMFRAARDSAGRRAVGIGR